MRKKQIVILEDSSKARLGGGQVVTLQVAGILREAGYELTLVDSARPSLFKEKMVSLVKQTFDIQQYGKIRNTKAASSYSMSKAEIAVSPFLFAWNTLQLARLFKKNGLCKGNTIMYSATKKGLITARILHGLTGIPFVHHAHSMEPDNLLSRLLTRPAMRKAREVICVSETVSHSLNIPNGRIIYNTVSPDQVLHAGTPAVKSLPEKIVIATFASLIRIKGIEFLISAIPLMRHQHRVECRIYGEGELEQPLRQQARPPVFFCGFTGEVNRILRQDVHVLAFTSVIREACPTIIVQALAAGVPVVSTNIGGQAELVKDELNGLWTDIRDSRQLAAQLDRLVENPDLYRKLAENALREAEKFEFKQFRTSIIAAFE